MKHFDFLIYAYSEADLSGYYIHVAKGPFSHDSDQYVFEYRFC